MASKDQELSELEPASDHPKAGTICAIDRKSVHRICSGQVVLTLATAVKELLENSIDAGATIVDIKLKEYGGDLIEVSDSGVGVHSDNFQGLTLKHHTSKLQDFSDLINVETFGFRGEALSSLCALSDMTITTRHRDAAVGTRLDFDHNGKITKQSSQARQIGTTVTLQNLFYTLPVRHKEFQKNVKREFIKMVQVLNSYCIISTGVRISCTNQTGKGSRTTVVSSQGSSSMLENIASVFGPKQTQSLLEFKHKEPSEDQCGEFGIKGNNPSLFRIEGYVSKCEHSLGRSSTDRQFFFINGRPFDSSKLSKVVNEVYHQYNRHQYPFVVFKISAQKDNVDVNVTPDKRQVFMEGEKLIMATVKASLVAMYEPTTSILHYQSVPLPNQAFAVKNSKADGEEFTRLVKHPSLEKPGGLSALMKLKRSYSSAFSKEDPISPVNKESPAVSNPQKKQKRLDAFVSSYHSPSKLREESRHLHTNKPADHDSVVIVPHKSQATESTGLTDRITDTVQANGSNDEIVTERSDGAGIKDTNAENSVIDERGDNLKMSVSVGKCKPSVGEEAEKFGFQISSGSVAGNSVKGDNSLCVQNGSCVQNNTSCVQNDLQVALCATQKCVQNKSLCVQNAECVQNMHTSTDQLVHVNACNGTGVQNCEGTENVSDLNDNLQNFLSGQDGKHIPQMTDFTPRLKIIEHESGHGRDVGSKSSGTVIHDDCDQIDVILEEHVDAEEDVERKERSVNFSMKHLHHRFKTKRENTCDKFSRTFRARISPSDNQAAEQELQKEIKKDMFSKMEILGQFNLGFIITKLEKDLFIVDQHATDEKYNFETLQRDTVIQSQKLICPLNLELTSSNETILMDNLEIFRKNGFEFLIDEEGIPTQRVKLVSTPVSRNWNFGKEDIEEMLFMLTDSPGVTCRPSRIRAMFASRACRRSIMIGTNLNKAEMRKLVCHMGEIEQPWNCPHGRPTMRHLINLDMVPK